MSVNKERELRSYQFEIRAESNKEGVSTLSGRPIVYDSPTDIGGWFTEVIDRGALDGADLTDVPLLVNHNREMIPVARSRRNTPNSTLRLGVDANGLLFDADVDVENNMTSRELDSAVRRGDIDEMSFAFFVDAERWENLDTDYPTRHIEKISKVAEISAVTWGAYKTTEIFARAKDALDNAKLALDNARSAANDNKDSLDNEKRSKELELEKAKFEALMKWSD